MKKTESVTNKGTQSLREKYEMPNTVCPIGIIIKIISSLDSKFHIILIGNGNNIVVEVTHIE